MKVKELIEILILADPEALVVLSKDGEGNDYSPVCDWDDSFRYEAESSYNGTLLEKEDVEEYEHDRWDEAQKCVVLWPVN